MLILPLSPFLVFTYTWPNLEVAFAAFRFQEKHASAKIPDVVFQWYKHFQNNILSKQMKSYSVFYIINVIHHLFLNSKYVKIWLLDLINDISGLILGFQDCSGKETPVLARWKVNCDFNAHLVHVLGRRTKILLIYIIRNLTVNYIDSNVFIVILNPELWFEDNWGTYTFFKEKWRLRINLVCLPCFSYIVRNCVSTNRLNLYRMQS